MIVVVGIRNRFALPLPLFPSFDLLLCCLSVCCLVMMFVCLLCSLSPNSILHCIAHTHTHTYSDSAFCGLQVSHVSAKWRPQNRHGVMQRAYVHTYVHQFVCMFICMYVCFCTVGKNRPAHCSQRGKRAQRGRKERQKLCTLQWQTIKAFDCIARSRRVTERDEEKETVYECKTLRESVLTNVQRERERET